MTNSAVVALLRDIDRAAIFPGQGKTMRERIAEAIDALEAEDRDVTPEMRELLDRYRLPGECDDCAIDGDGDRLPRQRLPRGMREQGMLLLRPPLRRERI